VRSPAQALDNRVSGFKSVNCLQCHEDHLLRLTQQRTYPIVATHANVSHDETMNTEWFRHLLTAKKLSQRKLAKLLNLDPAAISLMLRGQRRMTNEEAHQISICLGVPITEVLRQAGIEVLDDVRRLKVTGHVDDKSIVTLFPRRTHDRVIGPADCPEGSYALQMRSAGKPRDGWMLFVSPAEDDPRAHLGQLCCVALETGEHMIAFVQRGYRSGTFNLITASGETLRTDAVLVWASSVLWIKPL